MQGIICEKEGMPMSFYYKGFELEYHISILTYNSYEHEDEDGWPCHGKRDASREARSLYSPNISREIVNYVESYFYMGVSIDVVCKIHIDQHLDIDVEHHGIYLLLTSKDVVNTYYHTRKENYQLHKKYEISVNLWHQK